MSNEKKKFVVPVTWVMAGEVVVEAKNELEANDLANAMTLDKFENAAPVNFSLDVDFDMIHEVQTPEFWREAREALLKAGCEDTKAAVEDYVFWREATEEVK